MENSAGIKYLFAQRNFDSRKVNSYNHILLDTEFTDVTLATNDDKQVDAHRIILSSESLFFKRIFKMNARRDILIYLPNINHEELQILLEYIYLGQTEIGEGNLIKFLTIGKHWGGVVTGSIRIRTCVGPGGCSWRREPVNLAAE